MTDIDIAFIHHRIFLNQLLSTNDILPAEENFKSTVLVEKITEISLFIGVIAIQLQH